MIWAAWNESEYARLNVKQFAEMFGYSRPYLFKKLDSETIKKLNAAGFPQIKDTIGYALAHLVFRNLVFSEGYVSVSPGGSLEKSVTSRAVNLLQSVTVTTTRTGTVFTIQVARPFLDNCSRSQHYQRFNLADYTRFTHSRGQAYSAARKLYLHLLRKRRVWDNAKKAPGVKPSLSNFDKLCAVAGLSYADPKENARELRKLLELVGDSRGIKMTAEVTAEAEGKYSVQFKREDL
jgi:hypothetical protein